ncbi:uncharacterized protein DEA37_0010342, partial [Paragonimus westermani]
MYILCSRSSNIWGSSSMFVINTTCSISSHVFLPTVFLARATILNKTALFYLKLSFKLNIIYVQIYKPIRAL